MATYRHPGVYLEEIPSGARPIEAVGTSTAAFLGFAARGPEASPVFISSWDDYAQAFGGLRAVTAPRGDSLGHAVRAFFHNGGSAAYVVRLARGADAARGFMLPDGDPPAGPDDHLLRIEAASGGAWGNALRVELQRQEDGETPPRYTLVVEERRDGEYEEQERFEDLTLDESRADFIEAKVNDDSRLVQVTLGDVSDYQLGTSRSAGDLATLDPVTLNGKSFTVTLDGSAQAQHSVEVSFGAGAFEAGDGLGEVADEIQKKVRGGVSSDENPRKDFTCEVAPEGLVMTSGSRLPGSAVVVTPAADDDAAVLLGLGVAHGGVETTGSDHLAGLIAAGGGVVLDKGDDGSDPEAGEYDAGLAAVEGIGDVSILCLPGQVWADDGTGNAVIDAAIAQAERLRNRMVILDPPPGAALRTAGEVKALGLPTSTYAVLYYPWVTVSNPHYSPEPSPGAARSPRFVQVPPCGFAAGMWARTDSRRGVWKAPAGVETALLGLAGLEQEVQEVHQGALNPLGVNCLRSLPGFGAVIWGARTLATRASPEWRYVPVRRTAIFIQQSLYNGIQWAVFEPNDASLWSALRLNIEAFMNGLFRAGAFQGGKASDAYFVRCGLGDTMTQGDIDRGQVIVQVGFAPLKPAEFVIIRLQQKVGQA